MFASYGRGIELDGVLMFNNNGGSWRGLKQAVVRRGGVGTCGRRELGDNA